MLPRFAVDLTKSLPTLHASLRQSALLCLLAATAIAQSGSYRFDHWTTDNGLPQNTVRAIVQTRDGYLWLTTFDGLARFDGVRFTVFDKSNTPAITNNRFTALHEDKDGTLWAGAEQGEVVAYRDGVFTPYTSADGPRGVSIANFRPDFNDELMIVTGNRAYYLRAGKFIPTPPEYTNPRLKLYRGPSRTQWTIDSRGAWQVKDGRETHYAIKFDWDDALSDLDVYEDRQGGLWVNDKSGVYWLRDGQVARYTARDGLPPRRVVRPQCEDDDGGVWFSIGEVLEDGIAVIDPEAAHFNSQPPPVIIEGVTLERGRVDFSKGMSVAPGQRDLEINYSGLSLIKSEQVKFKYRLEGLDTDWVDVGTRRVVYFPYLPPGSYRFRVIAANSDGVWNNEGAALDIFVATPFYRAWWFITFVALSLAGIAALTYRRRFAALRARQAAQEAFSRRLIESQEQERKRIAAELHDSLSQNLVIIKNRAMISLQQRDDPEEVFEQVAEIAEAADHALFEVREIAHNLRPFQIDRLGLTKAIEAVVRKANAGALRFSAHLDKIDALLPPEAEINLYRIVQESVNNVVKHSQATEASVTIKRRDQTIEVNIQDNGQGFTPAATQLGQSRDGSGLGLAGINERARILGSASVIESAPGRGTKIWLEIRTIKS